MKPKPIVCPKCGSTSWRRVEDGMQHSEDVFHTTAGIAEETEDDHHDTDSHFECLECKTEAGDLEDDLLDALSEATWK